MDERRASDDSLLTAAPVFARMAAAAWLRSVRWGAEATVRGSIRMMRGLASGENPATVMQETGNDLRRYARELLGIADEMEAEAADSERDATSAAALRARGEELLRLSADVHYQEDSHPAFARILDQLAPDEARILRMLRERGPQPSVDVRSGGPLGVGIVATELVAPGLNMIGAEAGCRHLERVPAYLNNLYRLGLIWFSRESLEDPLCYQVLEAQPDVGEALADAGRGARTVRRSIHLTPFGADFCELCLPDTTGEFEALKRSDGRSPAPDAVPPPPSAEVSPPARAGESPVSPPARGPTRQA